MAHVHPDLRHYLGDLHHKTGGRLQWGTIVNKMGVPRGKLPTFGGFNVDTLCYPHHLGICPAGAKCPLADSHGARAPDSFVTNIVNCIKKGVEYVMEATLREPRNRKRPHGH